MIFRVIPNTFYKYCNTYVGSKYTVLNSLKALIFQHPAIFKEFLLTESVGFEPTCPVKDNCISSAARYDRFDNSPCHICNISLKKTSGKRRELMERTKVISVVNNTAKAPKNQGFLEKCFRSGHSFSSALPL